MKSDNLLLVRKKGSEFDYFDFGGYEHRNYSMLHLCYKIYKNIDYDFEFFISTCDRPIERNRTYCFSTENEKYDYVCPDFVFDSWQKIGIKDYETYKKTINIVGKQFVPGNNKVIWCGTLNSDSRKILYNKRNSWDFIDVVSIKDLHKGHEICQNFVSIDNQIKGYKYLLDARACGYSGRLKIFLWSNRIVFVSDRPYKEFFFQYMKPWEHYIPVKEDFSDFEENYNKIESDQELQKYILTQTEIFCNKYLTRDAALSYWKYRIIENQK